MSSSCLLIPGSNVIYSSWSEAPGEIVTVGEGGAPSRLHSLMWKGMCPASASGPEGPRAKHCSPLLQGS